MGPCISAISVYHCPALHIDIAKRIMAEEEEHEQDLQDLLRDVEWIVKAMETKC